MIPVTTSYEPVLSVLSSSYDQLRPVTRRDSTRTLFSKNNDDVEKGISLNIRGVYYAKTSSDVSSDDVTGRNWFGFELKIAVTTSGTGS